MILIVGLGNPGKKYQKTRHNIGFLVVESLKLKVKSFSNWKKIKRFQAEISKGKINDQEILLAKPQTFMNLSGKAVKKIILNLKSEILNLFVIHDDIDLPLGKIRISKGRGAAGHKGVESIIKELKTKNFVRFRIGIQPKAGKPKNVEEFVLQKPSEAKPSEAGDETKSQRPFNREEEKIAKEVIKNAVTAIETTLKEGLEKAMSKYNL